MHLLVFYYINLKNKNMIISFSKVKCSNFLLYKVNCSVLLLKIMYGIIINIRILLIGKTVNKYKFSTYKKYLHYCKYH